MRIGIRVGLAGVVVTLALVGGELVLRGLDGFVLFSVKLRPSQPEVAVPRQLDDRPDRQAVSSVPLADGVAAAWYESDPKPIPRLSRRDILTSCPR